MTATIPAQRSPIEDRPDDRVEALIKEARRRARRRRWIYLGAIGAVVFSAVAVAAMSREASRSLGTVSVARTPSAAPVVDRAGSGDLVAAVGKIHDGAWYLYADGRLISIDDQRAAPLAGWVEQRLTAAGVERVRAEFLASGMFDPNEQPSEATAARQDTIPHQRALVRDGATLLIAHDSTQRVDNSLAPCGGAAEPGTRCHLIEYLRGLEWSLPEDEWIEQQPSRYVPVRGALCLHAEQDAAAHVGGLLSELPSVVAQLPSPAPALLENRYATFDFFGSCFDLTIDEKRTLEAAFLDAFPYGWVGPAGDGAFELRVVTRLQLASTYVIVVIELWAALPHGQPAGWGG